MEEGSNAFFHSVYEGGRASFTPDDLVKYHVSVTKKFAIRREEVALEASFGDKGYRKGLYDFPNSIVCWGVTEIDPGVKSPLHRQLHEATHFILQGKGYSVVNGVRVDWEEGDVVFTPVYAWHQNVNAGDERVRYVTAGTVPFFRYLGIYREENHREPAQDELDRMKKEMPSQLVVKKKDWLPQTEAGQHPAFPFPSRVATNRMAASMAPKTTNKFVHRHYTEALIYIVKGRGYSLVHDRKVEWEPETVIRVPTFCWHTHDNPGVEREVHLRHVSSGLNNHLRWNLIDNLTPGDIGKTPLAALAKEVGISSPR